MKNTYIQLPKMITKKHLQDKMFPMDYFFPKWSAFLMFLLIFYVSVIITILLGYIVKKQR